jgi:hypothetical protein
MDEANVQGEDFKHSELQLTPAVTPFGNLVDRRVIDGEISRHMGSGIEYLEP